MTPEEAAARAALMFESDTLAKLSPDDALAAELAQDVNKMFRARCWSELNQGEWDREEEWWLREGRVRVERVWS